jgi:PIN domain nuclease of toxin-antitoxin system
MVIDASALLAYFQNEPGGEVVESIFGDEVYISSVTYTEVVGKLVGGGKSVSLVEQKLKELELEPTPFNTKQAQIAAYFYARRKPYNLALGDCATLALAEFLGEAVMTAERRWAELPDLKIEVKLIR